MPKGFKTVAANARSVYGTVIGSTQSTQKVQHEQGTPDLPEEPAPVQTQGRKGAKLPRINMAFSPQNLEYLRVMAGLRGQSVTKYVNTLVEQDMALNEDTYTAAKKIAGDR